MSSISQRRNSELIAQLVKDVTHVNVDSYLRNYNMPDIPFSPEDKVSFFKDEIQQYGPVIARSGELLPPPVLLHMSIDDIMDTLSKYTLDEIINTYFPVTMPIIPSRKNLYEYIQEYPMYVLEWLGSFWDWDYPFETLKYGVPNDERFYDNVDLIMSFESGKFLVPGTNLHFPLLSIKQLFRLIFESPVDTPALQDLLNIIRNNLVALEGSFAF